jgi:amino acid transporter
MLEVRRLALNRMSSFRGGKLSLSLSLASRAASARPWAAQAIDVFIYNVYFTSFFLALVFLYVTAFSVAPPRDLIPGILVASAVAVFPIGTYALMSITIPRFGGDYVYVGRVLHPLLGFLSSWNWVFWLCFWIGFGAYSFATVGLSGLLTALGLTLQAPPFLELSRWISTPPITFVIGTIVIAGIALLVSIGLSFFLQVQRWTFSLAVLATMAMVITLGSTSHEAFVARFNEVLGPVLNSADPYHAVIARVQGVPLERSSSFRSVLAVIPAAFLVLPWTIGSAFITPELREVQHSQIRGMLGALLFVSATTVLLGTLLVHVAGPQLLVALAVQDPSGPSLPLRPYFSDLTYLLLQNPVLLVVSGIGFLCMGWMYMAQNMINNSRVLLSWASDGLAPPMLGRIHPRLRTPVPAIFAVSVVAEAFLGILTFSPALRLLSSILALTLSVALVALSAAVLPYRRPHLFAASPAGWRLLGVPLLSLLGIGTLVALAMVDGYYLLDVRYGANSPSSLGFILLGLASGLVYYFIARRMDWGEDR